MFIIKNNYYLYIENTKNIDLNRIKKNKKISIIYRFSDIRENIVNLIKFRNQCRLKGFKFYIANNLKLAINCKADGLYVSAYNKKNYPAKRLTLIGSAHNFKEIHQKIILLEPGRRSGSISGMFLEKNHTRQTSA